MNINKKYIILPIIFVLGIWMFNIVRHQIYFLDEPIFIKNFVEKEVLVQVKNGENEEAVVNDSCIIELYYVDNFSNNTYVSNGINYSTVSFPEVNSQETYTVNGNGGFGFDMNNQGITYVEGVAIAPYRVKVLRIDLGQVFLQDGKTLIDKVKEETQVKISKVKFGFGDNSKVIDIGNINIRAVDYEVEENSFMKFNFGGSSSTNWNENEYEALKDIQITGLQGDAYENIKDSLEVKINEEALESVKFPIKVKAGERVSIRYKFDFEHGKKNIEPKLIDGYLSLNTIDSNGDTKKVDIRISNWYYSIAGYLEGVGNLNKLFKEK